MQVETGFASVFTKRTSLKCPRIRAVLLEESYWVPKPSEQHVPKAVATLACISVKGQGVQAS